MNDLGNSIEEILFANKMRDNHEKRDCSKGDNLIPLSDIELYEVSFPRKNGYITVGHMFSGIKPLEGDFLDLLPIENLKKRGEELIKEGKIKTLDELWKTYNICRKNTKLIKYRKLTKEEGKAVLFSDAD